MKRIVLMAVLALALPLAAFADNVDFGNSGGMLGGTASGLTLTGSELTQVNGFNGMGLIQGSLGSVAFTTGSLISGSLLKGGTFGPGGTFTITSNGTGGLPDGVIFKGTFTGTTTWTENGTLGGTSAVTYTLSGAISGTWYNGMTVSGGTAQLTIDTGPKGFQGCALLASGNTDITVTPEPGTLALLGTGLVGLAGIVRKKFKT
jgi:hypothetical protein